MNTFNYQFEISDYKSDKELKDAVNQILDLISEKKVQDYILRKLSKKDGLATKSWTINCEI